MITFIKDGFIYTTTRVLSPMRVGYINVDIEECAYKNDAGSVLFIPNSPDAFGYMNDATINADHFNDINPKVSKGIALIVKSTSIHALDIINDGGIQYHTTTLPANGEDYRAARNSDHLQSLDAAMQLNLPVPVIFDTINQLNDLPEFEYFKLDIAKVQRYLKGELKKLPYERISSRCQKTKQLL